MPVCALVGSALMWSSEKRARQERPHHDDFSVHGLHRRPHPAPTIEIIWSQTPVGRLPKAAGTSSPEMLPKFRAIPTRDVCGDVPWIHLEATLLPPQTEVGQILDHCLAGFDQISASDYVFGQIVGGPPRAGSENVGQDSTAIRAGSTNIWLGSANFGAASSSDKSQAGNGQIWLAVNHGGFDQTGGFDQDLAGLIEFGACWFKIGLRVAKFKVNSAELGLPELGFGRMSVPPAPCNGSRTVRGTRPARDPQIQLGTDKAAMGERVSTKERRVRTFTSRVRAAQACAWGRKPPLFERVRPGANSSTGTAGKAAGPMVRQRGTCAHPSRDSPGFGGTAFRPRLWATSSGMGARLPSPQPATPAYTPCNARGSHGKRAAPQQTWRLFLCVEAPSRRPAVEAGTEDPD